MVRQLAHTIGTTAVPAIVHRYRLIATAERQPEMKVILSPPLKYGLPTTLRAA